MSETFTMALAILNCHGIRDLPNNIQRKHKDVLTLDYMGLKFKVASENADKDYRFIKYFVFFYRQYKFNRGIVAKNPVTRNANPKKIESIYNG